MWHTTFEIAIQVDLIQVRQALPEPIAQGGDAGKFLCHLEAGQTIRLSHANDLVRGQRSGTMPSFVTSAVDLRMQPDTGTPPHIQRTDTLRTIRLVGGH